MAGPSSSALRPGAVARVLSHAPHQSLVLLLALLERVTVECRLAVDNPLQQLFVLLRNALEISLTRGKVERELGGAGRLRAGEALAALFSVGRVNLEKIAKHAVVLALAVHKFDHIREGGAMQGVIVKR